MKAARKALTALACLAAPPALKPPLLNLMGHRIARGARIGVSLVRVERLCMAAGARIGHLNWIEARRIALRRGAGIGFPARSEKSAVQRRSQRNTLSLSR